MSVSTSVHVVITVKDNKPNHLMQLGDVEREFTNRISQINRCLDIDVMKELRESKMEEYLEFIEWEMSEEEAIKKDEIPTNLLVTLLENNQIINKNGDMLYIFGGNAY